MIFLFALTPLIWFAGKGSALINGVDTNFPLDPWIWFLRRFFVWNNTVNAGSNFSSSTAGLFFHLIQTIPYILGFNLQIVEILSLVFWFGLIIFAAFLFSRRITKSKIAQTVFVVFYAFNIYMFNSWENVKVANLSLMASIPLTLWIFDKLYNKELEIRKSLLYIVGIGFVVSGTGINPAYFVCWLLSLLIYSFAYWANKTSESNFFKVARNVVIILAVVLSVNMLWLISSAQFISSSISKTDSLQSIGFTSWIDSLSENTSLVNVAKLQGAWDWYAVDDSSGLPLYIPYANKYFTHPAFIIFSLLVPTIALLSFVFIKKSQKQKYIAFGFMALLAIFLSAGTHAPTGSLFKWMSLHVPFFSLFRSPWYIFTPLLIISYAVFLSIFFDKLNKKRKNLTIIFSAIFIVGNLIYCYPLVTGRIFRTSRFDSFFVNFPDYVFETKNWLSDKKDIRIIGYPDDDIEQFNWGYRGVESVLNLFAPAELFFKPLNAGSFPVAKIISEFYAALKREQAVSVENLAQRLNVSLLFEKTDQPSLAPQLPSNIKTKPQDTFGAWNFYHLDDQKLKIEAQNQYVLVSPFESSQKVFALKNLGLVVNPSDSQIQQSEIFENSAYIVIAHNLQEVDYELHKRDKQPLTDFGTPIQTAVFKIDIKQEGEYSPVLENYRLQDFGLDEKPGLEIILDGIKTRLVLEQKEEYLYFKKIKLSTGEHIVSIPLKNNNLLLNQKKSDFDYNCFYAGIINSNGEAVIKQSIENRDVKIQTKTAGKFYYEPVITPSTLTLTPSGQKSEVYFYRLFCNKLMFIKSNDAPKIQLPEVKINSSSPVKYNGSVSNADTPHTLTFADNYSKDWVITLFDTDGKKININPPHFSADLYKNAWYINIDKDFYSFKIEYAPQKLFLTGAFFSILSIGICVILHYEKQKNKSRRGNGSV